MKLDKVALYYPTIEITPNLFLQYQEISRLLKKIHLSDTCSCIFLSQERKEAHEKSKESDDKKELEKHKQNDTEKRVQNILEKLVASGIFWIQHSKRKSLNCRTLYNSQKMAPSVDLFFDLKWSELDKALKEPFENNLRVELQAAYTHYLFGNYITAFNAFKQIANKAWNMLPPETRTTI